LHAPQILCHNRFGVAVGTQIALIEPEGARGDLAHGIHIVRHKQDGATLLLELADLSVALLLEVGVPDG
jgi:hypothetical protein